MAALNAAHHTSDNWSLRWILDPKVAVKRGYRGNLASQGAGFQPAGAVGDIAGYRSCIDGCRSAKTLKRSQV
jgi:hypothetical protein